LCVRPPTPTDIDLLLCSPQSTLQLRQLLCYGLVSIGKKPDI
jgi:hypothetical protein